MILILPFLTSCSLFWSKSNYERMAFKNYDVSLSPEWIPMEEKKNVDYAYSKNGGSELFIANSYCGDLQDKSLETILKQSILGIEKSEIIEEDYRSFKVRKAYEIIMKGGLDGVDRNICLLGFRKDHCYFELNYISQEKSIEDFKRQCRKTFRKVRL